MQLQIKFSREAVLVVIALIWEVFFFDQGESSSCWGQLSLHAHGIYVSGAQGLFLRHLVLHGLGSH